MLSSGTCRLGLILRNPTKRGLNLVNALAWARTKVSLMANSSLRKISTRLEGWFGMEAGGRRLDRPPHQTSHLVKHSGSLARGQHFAHRGVDQHVEGAETEEPGGRF